MNVKTDISKPRREAWNTSLLHSPQKEPILIPDFSHPELLENKFLLLTSPKFLLLMAAIATCLSVSKS